MLTVLQNASNLSLNLDGNIIEITEDMLSVDENNNVCIDLSKKYIPINEYVKLYDTDKDNIRQKINRGTIPNAIKVYGLWWVSPNEQPTDRRKEKGFARKKGVSWRDKN